MSGGPPATELSTVRNDEANSPFWSLTLSITAIEAYDWPKLMPRMAGADLGEGGVSMGSELD
jgi:hypothetical protein